MSRTTLPLLLLSLAACSTADAGNNESVGATDDSAANTSTNLSEGAASSDTDSPTSDEGGTVGQPSTTDPTTGDPTPDPLLPLDGPCALGPALPARLAVITNDFIEPARLHVLDLATRELTLDVADVPSDPALAWGDGKLVVIGRYGFNTLTVLDGQSYAPLATLDVKIDGVADANPQALTFGPDGRAYLSAFASAIMPVYDLDQPPAPVTSLDLGAFADRDGSPEPGLSFTCGATLFVGIQRLLNFAPQDLSYLVAIDLASGAPIDLDPGVPGPQGLPLLGPWPKQVRLDPTDPGGHTVLVLTSGIERVALDDASSSWAVTPELLATLGIGGYDLQAFELAADGASAYIIATVGDYPGSALFHVPLDGAAAPDTLIAGLSSRERAIERVGDHLWIGDADPQAPRLRVLDLGQSPALEQPAVPMPGAPYLFLPIP